MKCLKHLINGMILSLPLIANASPVQPETKSAIQHVIYITFDGTRWQDIFENHPYFPKLWNKYAAKGHFYGAPDSGQTMEVASIPVSLPSYQSQMSGAVQICAGNDCGRIFVQTFPERLIERLHLSKKQVATFASWPTIEYAVEHISGTTFVNTGNMPVYDPDTNQADAVMAELNKQQAIDYPIAHERYDKYTIAHALHYFDKYQPTFLWISLNDADAAAHANDLDKYHAALQRFDDTLDQLFTMLKTKGLEDNTMVIVTTDHGRGNGKNWTHHGLQFPESKQTWAFVMNGELATDKTKDYYSTNSIRSTVETVFGI